MTVSRSRVPLQGYTNKLLVVAVTNKIDDLQDEIDDTADVSQSSPTSKADGDSDTTLSESQAMNASFMSESIYEKIPSPRSRRPKIMRRKSIPIRHEHFEPGSNIREIQAHNDMITALDFDFPFGTMVTAALDDTVRVWDLNAGRCMGMLEGHHGTSIAFSCPRVLLILRSLGQVSSSRGQPRSNWIYGCVHSTMGFKPRGV